MSDAKIGARMREIALRSEFWDDLADCGWLDGGCRIYAEAAAAYLGPTASIAYVIAEGATYGPIVDHAVVIAGEWVFDGDGATPLESFLTTYAGREGRAEAILELLDADDVADDPQLRHQARELPENSDLSQRLAAAWRNELRDPQ
jgi:hypothetical protein